MRKVINVYNTHIEIHPYHLGENPQLEHTFSTYDAVEHHYNPIGYCVCGDTLYLPRGTIYLNSNIGLEKPHIW